MQPDIGVRSYNAIALDRPSIKLPISEQVDRVVDNFVKESAYQSSIGLDQINSGDYITLEDLKMKLEV